MTGNFFNKPNDSKTHRLLQKQVKYCFEFQIYTWIESKSSVSWHWKSVNEASMLLPIDVSNTERFFFPEICGKYNSDQ